MLDGLSEITTPKLQCLQYVNLLMFLCSFLSWVLMGETMKQMVICLLKQMYWPMTVLPGEVYSFLLALTAITCKEVIEMNSLYI